MPSPQRPCQAYLLDGQEATISTDSFVRGEAVILPASLSVQGHMQPEGLGRPATRQPFPCVLLDDLSLKVAKVSIPMGKSEEKERRRGQVPPKGPSNSAPPHPPCQVRYQAPEEPCPLAGPQDLPLPQWTYMPVPVVTQSFLGEEFWESTPAAADSGPMAAP